MWTRYLAKLISVAFQLA